jgi:glycogen synthase
MTDLLFVGRPAPEKGLRDLLFALADVPLTWQLHLAGEPPSVSEQARRASIHPSRITLHGAIPNRSVADLMRCVDVVVVPSRYENFGNVALEAMASGRIVVAARTGGMIDLIVDGFTGLHFPPGDVAALSQRLSMVLTNVDSFRGLAIAARRAAMAYGWEEVTRTTALVLRRFI